MVMGHLAVTGGLALSDNLLQHVVGKGLLGRLSARFGEGAVNGILTARIGLAARDVCRPIPQETSAKETLGSLMRELVSLARSRRPNERQVNLNPDVQRSHNLRNALHTVMLIAGTGAAGRRHRLDRASGPTGLIWAAIFGAVGLWTLGRVSPIDGARPLQGAAARDRRTAGTPRHHA